MKPLTYKDAIRSTTVVLVEFFATWCPHCQKMMPVVDEIKQSLAGKVNVYQFDIDKYQGLDDENNVEVVPTFIIYVDGREVWRQSGEMTKDQIMAEVDRALKM